MRMSRLIELVTLEEQYFTTQEIAKMIFSEEGGRNVREALTHMKEFVATMSDETLSAPALIEAAVKAYIADKGLQNGLVLWPLRVALSTRVQSASPFEYIYILHKAESIKRMAEWKGHFDPTVFQAFVKSLGIYPIGSLVRLESGKLGVVVEQGEQSLLKPKVKVFFSTKSQAYIKPELIDIARSPEKIAGREDAAKWGIKDVDRYWAGDKV
jgi:hypothetical protein